MKVATWLERRQANWLELDRLARQAVRRMDAPQAVRLAELYRSACADLALADAYQLPPNTVQYLHQLVGRAHNQLYRSRRFDIAAWGGTLLHDVPRRIRRDRCIQVVFVLFWATFLGAATLAHRRAGWAEEILPPAMLQSLEENFKEPLQDRDPAVNYAMAAFYIRHNTGIGLRCFAWGLLIIPGVREVLFNALVLGAAFGYMARPDVAESTHFFHFVTAHGPFELTAIVLAAGAGLRLGMGWIRTGGLTRVASLQRTAVETMPMMGAAMLMFLLAALIEGFLSPAGLPYAIKAGVALLSTGMLAYYFLYLGSPRRA